MTVLFVSVLFLVLLLLLQYSFKRLYPIMSVLLFFILFQFISRQLFALFTNLATLFQHVPYSNGLLYTALLFVMKEVFCALLEQFDYEAYAVLVTLSIRITLVVYWVGELTPAFQILLRLAERLS